MKMSERKDCNFIIGDGPRDLARLRCSAISYFVRNAIPFSTPAEDPYHDARMAPGIRILGLRSRKPRVQLWDACRRGVGLLLRKRQDRGSRLKKLSCCLDVFALTRIGRVRKGPVMLGRPAGYGMAGSFLPHSTVMKGNGRDVLPKGLTRSVITACCLRGFVLYQGRQALLNSDGHRKRQPWGFFNFKSGGRETIFRVFMA